MHRFRLAAALFWVSISLLGVGTSRAETICGDADGDTTVSVTDGVLILRAAAGLSSTCSTTVATCDVDDNGRIGVTDAVRVLRLAADLPVVVACNLIAPDVQGVVDSLVPFVTIGLSDLAKAVASAQDATIAATKTSGCPLGGSITSDSTDTNLRLTLDACIEGRARIGNFQFDGTIDIVIASGVATFDLAIEDLRDGRVSHFTGTLSGRSRTGGGLIFTGTSFPMATPDGAFELSFDALEINAQGDLAAGSCRADDQNGNLALTSVSFVVRNATAVDVHAIFDNATIVDAVLNPRTGSLTPAD